MTPTGGIYDQSDQRAVVRLLRYTGLVATSNYHQCEGLLVLPPSPPNIPLSFNKDPLSFNLCSTKHLIYLQSLTTRLIANGIHNVSRQSHPYYSRHRWPLPRADQHSHSIHPRFRYTVSRGLHCWLGMLVSQSRKYGSANT